MTAGEKTLLVEEKVDTITSNTMESNDNDDNKNNKSSSSSSTDITVSFTTVEIREYARCLGDNPSSSRITGPSLSIDWQYESLPTINIDEYELNRSKRRLLHELQIPGPLRTSIIKQHVPTCTKQDISKNIIELRKIQHQRKMCIALQEYEQWQIIYESCIRKIKRFKHRTITTKQKQQKQQQQQQQQQQQHQYNAIVLDESIDDSNKSNKSLLSFKNKKGNDFNGQEGTVRSCLSDFE